MAHFTQHSIESASPEGAEILQNIQNGYGFIPNLFSYMIEAPATVEAYLQLTKLLEKTSLTPAQAQVAMLAASMTNRCNFCAVAHRAIGKKSGANQQTLDALANGYEIEDADDKAIATLVKAIVEKRGWLEDEDLLAFYGAGFKQQQVFELILTVTIKTLSNYSNHLTQPEPNPELLAMI